MAPPKKVSTYVKLQIEAGKATPAPPVGPALGQAQISVLALSTHGTDYVLVKGGDLARAVRALVKAGHHVRQ